MQIYLPKISTTNSKNPKLNNLQKANLNFCANKNQTSDTFAKTQKERFSKEEKQELIKKARTTSSGWATVGTFISTIYFLTRSNEKIAQKYNLDTYQDEKLINRIKREQVLWTLPGVIPGAGIIVSGATWLYNKKSNPEKIKI